VGPVPYVLEKRGNEWCVKSTTSGKTHGCHPTREQAIRQQRALYANAPESIDWEYRVKFYEELYGLLARKLGWDPADERGNMPAMSALAEEPQPVVDEEQVREPWEGVLGTIGSPTSDGRYLIPGQISNRDLPVPFSVQPAQAEGHDGAMNAGRIEEIEYIPFADFERKDEFYSAEQIANMPKDAVVIFGSGSIDDSEPAREAKRQIANGADVSLDGLKFTGTLHDPESFEEIDTNELEMGALMQGLMDGSYLQGVAGKIGGVTVVGIGAFEAEPSRRRASSSPPAGASAW
jgi:hypothetical protein